MDAYLPSVSKSLNHFRFAGQVLIFTISNFSLFNKRLEVGTVFDSVGGVDVDHLDLAAHRFFFKEAVHHQQAVARDEAVTPVMGMLVEFDGLAQGRVLPLALEKLPLTIHLAVAFADRLDDGAGVDPLVDVQGDGGDPERGSLRLARPAQMRV